MGIDSKTILNTAQCLKHLCFEQNLPLAHLLKHNLPGADVISRAFDIGKLKDWISEHNVLQMTSPSIWIPTDAVRIKNLQYRRRNPKSDRTAKRFTEPVRLCGCETQSHARSESLHART